MNNIYYAKDGEYGLTRTQAQHLCALASHLAKENETILNNTNFVNSKVGLIGSNNMNVAKKGITDVVSLTNALEVISNMNAFIAWFREADKDIQAEIDSYDKMSLNDYLEKNNIEMPEDVTPVYSPKYMTEKDALEALNIKDRELYLSLEAKAAVFGKYIQDKGILTKARQIAHDRDINSISVDENGRDTIIYEYSLSIPVKDIDDYFNSLQFNYRNVEQQLNHMKSDLKAWVDAKNREIADNYRKLLDEADTMRAAHVSAVEKLRAEFKKFRDAKITELSKYRLRVPEALKVTEKMLSNLGK